MYLVLYMKDLYCNILTDVISIIQKKNIAIIVLI